MCACGSIENSQHFCYHTDCPYHQQHTDVLLNTASHCPSTTLDFLLYGKSSLSYDTNMIVFESIHRFVINCKRFSLDDLITTMIMGLPYYSYLVAKRHYIPFWMPGARSPTSSSAISGTTPSFPTPFSLQKCLI